MKTISYLGNSDLELLKFSNSGQIILSVVFHKSGYSPHLTNEKAEAQSSTTPSEHRGPVSTVGQCAGWLLLDHTADISAGPAESGSRSYKQCNEMAALPFR